MNRAWNVIATVVVLSMLGCASGGCAVFDPNADAAHRAYSAKVAYATVLEQLVSLHDAGYIDQATIDATKPARQTARIALDVWEASARAGDKAGATDAESKFSDAKAIIQRVIDAIRPSTTRPATHASSRVASPSGDRHGPDYDHDGVGDCESDPRLGFYGGFGRPGYYCGRMVCG